MPPDLAHLVGIEPLLTNLNPTNPLPGLGLQRAAGLEGGVFDCHGGGDTITWCPDKLDEFYSLPNMVLADAVADSWAGYKDLVGSSITFGDVVGDTDFFRLRVNSTGDSTADPAIGCGLDDNGGPICVYGGVNTGHIAYQTPISFDFSIVAGTNIPPVDFDWGPNDPSIFFIADVVRTDDPANWPYQNPDPAYASQGRYFFRPSEVEEISHQLHGLGLSHKVNYSQEIHVEPYKWSYGYGPRKGQLMCLV